VTQDRRNIWEWQKVVDARNFDIALDFSGDFYDDPSLQIDQIRRRGRCAVHPRDCGARRCGLEPPLLDDERNP
jgi:hypothetical protein